MFEPGGLYEYRCISHPALIAQDQLRRFYCTKVIYMDMSRFEKIAADNATVLADIARLGRKVALRDFLLFHDKLINRLHWGKSVKQGFRCVRGNNFQFIM
jgi:hypothetical protein